MDGHPSAGPDRASSAEVNDGYTNDDANVGVTSPRSDSGDDVTTTTPTTLTTGQHATHLSPNALENGDALRNRRHVSGSSDGSATMRSGMEIENMKLAAREIRASSVTIDYPDADTGDEAVSLVYQRHECIRKKDFASEVRATLDVENFIERARLALDIHETTLDSIFDSMLHNLLDRDEPECAVSDAKRALFTQDSVHHLARTIQSSCGSSDYGFDYDQSWLCVICSVSSVLKRHVLIARLKNAANLGRTSQEVHFIILVIVPTKEKDTKNALETGRTFATLFSDMDLRARLMAAHSEDEFKQLLSAHSRSLTELRTQRPSLALSSKELLETDKLQDGQKRWMFARDLRSDFWRRWPYYISDYVDGLRGYRTLYKSLSTIVFLYFACILPSIALGVLNDKNTNGDINVKKVIYSQFIGGAIFALFSGQPMIILLTTAPLALYTKLVYIIAKDNDIDFLAMYACTGLFNSLFLVIYSLTGASRLMKWSTRSTEEIFALFISIAFTVDACKDIYHEFDLHYHTTNCSSDALINGTSFVNSSLLTTTAAAMTTAAPSGDHLQSCFRESSLLFLLLALGTVWFGLLLFNFTKTPYLNSGKRQLLADFALPVAVIVMSFFGSYVFKEIHMTPFAYVDGVVFALPNFSSMSLTAVFGSMGLGFSLSLLFFMDQNISGAMVNSPENRLKKGPAYSWDLFVVALINGGFTLLGMPMVHGALPHSPLHVRAMADMEDRVDQGNVHQRVVFVRETRVTGLVSHVLIGLSLLLLPAPLNYIPRPVLDGLFLYLAVTALTNNQMFDRITLLLTEQAQYPPTHYVSRVPQRKLHLFTVSQLLQLAVMCAVGFAPLPYVKMGFPVIIMLLLPIRHKFIPLFINKKFLNFLDGH